MLKYLFKNFVLGLAETLVRIKNRPNYPKFPCRGCGIGWLLPGGLC